MSVPSHISEITHSLSLSAGAGLMVLCAYEWVFGRYQGGKKTREDWMMAGIAISFLGLVQRPLQIMVVFFVLTLLFADAGATRSYIDQEYFWPGLIIYILVDEYLHGRAHLFTHAPPAENKIVRSVQNFYKVAHRPHHQIGGKDGRGQLTATHTYVEHWGWWLILPNYWFGVAALFAGFYSIFFWGTLIKALWGMHVHTNWGKSYDLYLLNHKNVLVRKTMMMISRVLVFPNMHHQHHSRGKNSAKNMCNLISLYDWLLWDSFALETKKPEGYGWHQSKKEASNPFYRFFSNKTRKV